MRLLFDAATDELHAQLSSWAHGARPQRFIVRRLLPESNTITMDLVGARPAGIDRFVVAFGPREDGNCETDGVNLRHRRLPTAITATAGTLTTTRLKKTLHTPEALKRWVSDDFLREGGHAAQL